MSDGSHDDEWIARWLDEVTEASMTQRTLASIEKHGGLQAIREAAQARGIHLLELTGDKGTQIVAASAQPFRVIC